jgi:protein-disulfide isomerase
MRPDAKKKIATVTPKKGLNPIIIGAVVAAVLIVGVVVAIVMAKNSGTTGTSSNGSADPVGIVANDGGGILANAATVKGNAPTVDLYEDFQCPTCGALEKAMGPTFASMAKTGEIRLIVHTLSFLDDNLKNDSSKRSANAVACASDAGKFLEYHAAVFAAQPAQEGAGYTDAQLTAFATEVGITGPALTTWQKCTTSGQHDVYVADTQTNAEKAGVSSTPTVKLDGKDITRTLTTVEALVARVKAATK